MRVAYDITPIDERPSGIGHYALHLLSHLREISPSLECLPLSNRAGRPSLLAAGCAPHAPTRPYPSRMVWMQCVLPGLLRELAPHLCHYTNSIGPLFNPCPYVVTIHDMTLSQLPGYHPWRKQLLVRPIIVLVARRAQRIITVSEHARQDVIRLLRVPPARVIVTPEAAAPIFRPASEAEQRRVREAYGLEGPYLLYVGTLEPRKNLVRLISAWASLYKRGAIPHRLVVVGAKGWQHAPIYRQAQQLGCAEGIVFTGYVPLDDLPALYSAADAFAFPSLAEGFGLPVVEAMACGTPVLTSSAPALVEVAGGAALHVEARSVAAISAGVERLLSDQDLRLRLRERGVARAAEYSWQRTARQTLAVYDSVAYGTPAAHVARPRGL